jgi:hypothetical protein
VLLTSGLRPNAPGVNPQVTIMALAAHFSHFIQTRI